MATRIQIGSHSPQDRNVSTACSAWLGPPPEDTAIATAGGAPMTTSTTDDEDEASSAADGRTPNTVRVPVRTEGLFGAEVNAEVDVEVAGQWDTRVWHDHPPR